jgi:TetR/AcrR family transcriptional regulator, transcriptional repressor for nem operon
MDPRLQPRPRRTSPADPTTATRILDEAERLTQTRGFNGFSYADIAAVVGTTKAALHYHFPSKADLGNALIARYAERFFATLDEIGASGAHGVAASERLRHYIRLYADVLSQDRLCLCGMLAAEYTTLPETMGHALRAFFSRNEGWLSALLEEGRRAGTLRFDGPPQDSARALTAALEGAMLLARAHGDPRHFDATADYLTREMTAAA